ncbi:TPA: TcpQ domain-containing protein [Salmonella enterica subsp. salamae serovar 35:g,m,s,t:-]|nr:TcpQ domain-containing protein [Salmonella enterica subsp. salamae serovar 35:g,m,s,t:-]HCA3549680.1 TcpQ domain-containing protein [Salmonella enterica subsp. salamae serovar 35:g,m,s,t:-]
MARKHLICSILVLTGCQSDPGRINVQEHSNDLIDKFLSQASLTLASTQAQFYPPKPATPSASFPVLTPPSLSATGMSNIAFVGAGNSKIFVTRDGRNLSVGNALNAIIPGGWTYRTSGMISAKKRVSWVGNDEWLYVLDRLARDNHWFITIDWEHHSVLVQDASEHKTSQELTVGSSKASSVASSAQVSKSSFFAPAPKIATLTTQKPLTADSPTSSPAKVITPPAPPVATNPFKGSSAPYAGTGSTASPTLTSMPTSISNISHKTDSSIKAKAIPISKPVATTPPPEVKEWIALTGHTLKDTIYTWASTADCTASSSHWTVAWLTSTDYRIDAPLHFSGTFKNALNGVFELYQGATVPLYAGTNTSQCILKVDSKPVQ